MKKIVLTCMSLVLLTGCFSKSGQTKFPTPSTNYTYTSSPLKLEDGDIDKYLMQDNVQYIDLRSHKDKAAGYIDGFEFMPYWEFLWEDSTPGKGRGQNGELSGWQLFSSEGKSTEYEDYKINKEFLIEQYFDREAKAIMLMCLSASSCSRSGLVKRVLDNDFGYTNTYNIGGWLEYEGKYRVTN